MLCLRARNPSNIEVVRTTVVVLAILMLYVTITLRLKGTHAMTRRRSGAYTAVLLLVGARHMSILLGAVLAHKSIPVDYSSTGRVTILTSSGHIILLWAVPGTW